MSLNDNIYFLAQHLGSLFADFRSSLGAKYERPSGGVPKTDMASAVQTSLGKADTAVQPAGLTKAAVGLGNVDNTADANKAFLAAQITDMTATGAAVVKATSASAGRTALGAASAAADTKTDNILVATSATTTAAINAFLALGGYRAIRGTATLTDSLVIPSNTCLDASGASIVGATTANLIQNFSAVPQRTVPSASGTAGSSTLTAAGAAFTSADVGKRVEIVGLGPNANASAPGSWYATIVSVTNSTTAVVDTGANITGTGQLFIYPLRDNNIEIFGGTWFPGNKNAISQNQESHGFRIRRADNINIHDVHIQGPGVRNVGGQYSMSFGDVTRVMTTSLRFQDTNSDGIHFQGPSTGIHIENVTGRNTGDDMVAFTGVDGQTKAGSRLGDTEGDIIDVEVHNVTGYDVWTHLKITGGTGPGGVLRRVAKFNAVGIHGNSATGSPVNIVNYAGTTTFSGRIAEVFAVGASTTSPQVISSAGNVLALTVDGVHWPATNDVPSSGVVVLSGTHKRAVIKNVTFSSTSGDGNSLSPAVYVNSTAVDYLEIDGTYANDTAIQNFIAVQIAAAVVMERLIVRVHHSMSVTGNAIYFTGSNWNIAAIEILNSHRYRGSWIDGTGTSTFTSDISATGCTGGSAWILLRQPANIAISGCAQSGGSGAGIRMIGATATPVTLTVAGSQRGNGNLLSLDGSQSVRVKECLCIPIADATVTASGNGDIYASSTVSSVRIRSAGAWKTL